MKRSITTILLLSLLLVLLALPLQAEQRPADSYVTVSIAVNGELVMVEETIDVYDKDMDGTITLDDVLMRAHLLFCPTHDKGYATAKTDYGTSLVKLWGDESGAFGYYVNNESALNLDAAVQSGDRVYAFVYKDQSAYSDSFSYFNVTQKSFEDRGTLILTLQNSTFNENWELVTAPTVGAYITIDGEKTEVKTDEQGKAKLSFLSPGKYVVSAVSDESNLVPPVCIVTVTKAPMNPLIIVILIVAVVGGVAGAITNAIKKKRA